MDNAFERLVEENEFRKLQISSRVLLEELYQKRNENDFNKVLMQSVLRNLFQVTGHKKYSLELAKEFEITFEEV